MYFAEQQFTDQKLTKILPFQYLKKFKPHEKLYDSREKHKNVPKRHSLIFHIQIVEYADVSNVLIYSTDKI